MLAGELDVCAPIFMLQSGWHWEAGWDEGARLCALASSLLSTSFTTRIKALLEITRDHTYFDSRSIAYSLLHPWFCWLDMDKHLICLESSYVDSMFTNKAQSEVASVWKESQVGILRAYIPCMEVQ